ncbi:MAG: CRTAC1 family protein [Myxococcota bacterium]
MDTSLHRLALSLGLLAASCSASPDQAGLPGADAGPAPACEDGGACGPREACRRSVCRGGTCVEEALSGPCEDGDLCTEGDRCEEGLCVAGAAKVCRASESCRVASCEPATGACVEVEAQDGTLCSDGDGCTNGESCQGGACVGGEPFECPLTNCMIANVCRPELSRCVPVFAPDETPCSDENICTEDDVCRDGVCEPGSPADRGPRCSEGLCFTEVSESLGLRFAPNPVFDVEGAGAAVADFDGDGWMDVVVFQEATQPKLFINEEGSGFRDQSEDWGLEVDFEVLLMIQGLAAGDLDDDGDPELVMVGEGANLIFWNEDGRFSVDARSIADAPKWAVGAALGDADADGDLDVLVANYITPPSSFPFHDPQVNTLFLNEGARRFVDVSEEVGLRSVAPGTTYAIAFTDFDGDGVQDIIECNDFGQFVQPNRWLRGGFDDNGGLLYQDVAPELGTDLAFYCMTIAAGDFDRDGDLDYYHTNIGAHPLLRNLGGRFDDVGAQLGVQAAQDACFTRLKSAGWGAGFRDFDLDGWPDLFASAGWVPSTPMDENPRQSENTMFHRVGDRFVDVAASSGIGSDARSKGVVFFDYDRDGDVDVLVVNMVQGPELFRNDSPRKGGWLELGFLGRTSSGDGFGAQVLADFGTFSIRGEHQPHGGYASASEPRLHFGAGPAERAELTVTWTSGIEQRLEVKTNASHRLVEPVALIEVVQVNDARVRVELRRVGSGRPPLTLGFLDGDGELLSSSLADADDLELPMPVGAVRVRVFDAQGGRDERPL